MFQKINWSIVFIAFLSTNWHQVKAMPNVDRQLVQSYPSQSDLDLFRSVIDEQIDTDYSNLEALLRLQSRESRSQLFAGLFTSAKLRAIDPDYRQETESLQTKIKELERVTGISKDDDLINASFAHQALYLEALLESLQDPWKQLKPENIKRKYREGVGKTKDYDLTILSVKNNTALLGLSRQNGQKKYLVRLVKEDGRWVDATKEEVNLARISKNKFNYVYSSFLPSLAEIPFLSDKKLQNISPEWYKTLPPTTAKQKELKVGDVVVAFLSKGFGSYRVISLETGKNGDRKAYPSGNRASLIDSENKIYQNIPLALLHKPENFIDRDRELQIGDAVFVPSGSTTIFRLSKIKDFQPVVKYVSFDEVKEATPRSIILPFPETGYLLRKVAYRHDGDIEVGMVVAESETKVWIDTPSPVLEVIAVPKTDVKPLNIPDADLRARKVWRNTYSSMWQVQIVRVMEPGLLYEIKKKYGDEYDFLSFDEISLEEPAIDSSSNIEH